MKRLFLLIAIAVSSCEIVFSQTQSPESKPHIEIFTDFHVSLNDVSSNAVGFGLNRAFFGYTYAIDKNFYAVLTLNIANPEDLAKGSKARRYAFFREVSVNYANERINLSMGMIKTSLFIFQQGFWGMRYIARPFQELNGYGLDSDLGLSAKYTFNDMFEADISIINGEGGGNLQIDNNIKTGAGFNFRPAKNIVFRTYDDIMRNGDVLQNTFLFFAGFKTDRYFAGADFTYKTNLDTLNGHDSWGISATAGYNISDKWMIFTRYDYSTSVIPEGNAEKWNFAKDGSLVIPGIQYTVSKAIRISLDYQGKLWEDKSQNNISFIFLHLALKI
jgi:hypothetical protein